jgi:hypothetical protein
MKRIKNRQEYIQYERPLWEPEKSKVKIEIKDKKKRKLKEEIGNAKINWKLPKMEKAGLNKGNFK